MTTLDLGILREWLNEYEKYVGSIKPADPRFDIAQEMLGIIAGARDSLHPSADSTANFVQNKEVIQQLAMLRDKADNLLKLKP
ncbi:MAG: hypothetical protein WAO76_11510 [Georgfuchsia sp.]